MWSNQVDEIDKINKKMINCKIKWPILTFKVL